MVFSFNFSAPEEGEKRPEKRKLEEEGRDRGPEGERIVWKEAKEVTLEDSHLQKIANLTSIEHFEVDTEININFVNSSSVGSQLQAKGYSGDLSPALGSGTNTDLVPGKYEGGLKIWECSEDLVRYLHGSCSDGIEDKKVLELGCGAGLPGIYCFLQGAEVWFNDYNEDVLEEVTIPNTLLNVPAKPGQTRFFSGDWGSLEKILSTELGTSEESKFDVILTSETIYNPDNQAKLVSIFKNFTKKGGQVLVAAKTVYFGVGGGVRQFVEVVKDAGLLVEVVHTFEGGVNREILKVTLR